jgi:hypothetical protein
MTTIEKPQEHDLRIAHSLTNQELQALGGVIDLIGLDGLHSRLLTAHDERQRAGLHSDGIRPGSWHLIRRFGPVNPARNDLQTTAVVSLWNGTPSPYRRRDRSLPQGEQNLALRQADDTGMEIEIIRDGTKRHAVLDIDAGTATYREFDIASGAVTQVGGAAEAYGLARETFDEYFALPLAVGAIATESAI